MTTGTGYGTPALPLTGQGYGTPEPDPSPAEPTPAGTTDPDSTTDENGTATTPTPTSTFDPISKIKLPLKRAIRSTSKKGEVINGTVEADTLVSGKGADTMRGDEGADYFVYKKKNNFGKKEADKVIDFSPEEGDKLIIKGKSFSIKSKKGATLAIGKGKKNVKNLAREDVDFIYDSKSGKIFFNSNDEEKGFGNKGGYFGVLKGSPTITSEDVGLI